MKKEEKALLKLAKKNLPKEIYKKLKKIEDEDERLETTRNALLAHLRHEHLKIEESLKNFQKQTDRIFFAKTKMILLPSKIKFFQATRHHEEFSKAKQLLNEINSELANV